MVVSQKLRWPEISQVLKSELGEASSLGRGASLTSHKLSENYPFNLSLHLSLFFLNFRRTQVTQSY
jgi:hypothetical protein